MQLIHPKKSQGKKIVIVVGAGFAGLNAAKALSKNSELHILLLDQTNHHLFQPLLYQVATAGLNPADIAVPIRSEFAGVYNVEVHLGKIDGVELKTCDVITQKSRWKLNYDYLILACGAQHSYFGHPEWETYAPGLKTLDHATEIRHRILSAFEQAENELDENLQQQLLTFIVVGGGPTGVELAGAIADISKTVLVKDFQRINPSQAKIILIEAGARVLSAFAEDLSAKAFEDLIRLGVDVRTSSRVEAIDENGVTVNQHFIPCKNILWAAGVQAQKMNFDVTVDTDRVGRIKVQNDLSLPGYKNVFVIGDMASVQMKNGSFVPGLAPAAIQQGKHIGKIIRADIQGASRPEFNYKDKGIMATIGKNKAVVESGPLKLTGYLAWLAWLFLHVFYLVGFKNRIAVMLYWAWSYLFSKRGARLILREKDSSGKSYF